MIPVVIPSKDANNLHVSVAAVRRYQPDARIIVVDDGLVSVPDGVETVQGVKPFVFARNINIGIRRALDRDGNGVVLLNDDAILETSRGFEKLARIHVEHPECGVVAPASTNTGNLNQRSKGMHFRIEKRMVCFTCVYIPRSTLANVGLLDERFIHYGFDDDDYCLRVRLAGLKIGITDDVLIDHGKLKSSYRGDPKTPADLHQNAAIFRAKWGADNHAL